MLIQEDCVHATGTVFSTWTETDNDRLLAERLAL